MTAPALQPPWDTVDWSQSSPAIAASLGVPVADVTAVRRAIGLGHTIPTTGKRYDWSGVDWSQTPAEIARQVGCTHAAARAKMKGRKP
jgi:hypothetical protein